MQSSKNKKHHRANASNHTEEQRIEQAEHRWQDFLNNSWGIFGFPLGIACLTTKTPSLNALLCIVFLLALWGRGHHQIPKHFLSKRRGGTPDPRPWRKRWKFWFGTLPALIGYIYLSFIAVSALLVAYCTPEHHCSWVATLVSLYVGAPH